MASVNPVQPAPLVLSSNLNPPPVWPLPAANWVVLPVVAAGFNGGPFTTQPPLKSVTLGS